MFVVECIHCRQQVAGPLERISEVEAAALRLHLRSCARDISAESVESVGELLNHFRLTRTV